MPLSWFHLNLSKGHLLFCDELDSRQGGDSTVLSQEPGLEARDSSGVCMPWEHAGDADAPAASTTPVISEPAEGPCRGAGLETLSLNLTTRSLS